MRKFWGLIIFVCLLFSGNCFAMQFSSVEKLGSFGQPPNQGFFFYNVAHNSGVYFNGKDEKQGYKSGIARLGEGKDAIYFHYDLDKDIFKFGSENVENAIYDKFYVFDVFKITTDEGIIIYPIHRPLAYNFIAKTPTGKFIKYIDTYEITRRYFDYDDIEDVGYGELETQGDTLTMLYLRKDANLGEGEYMEGRIYLKWNDEKQNFDVIIDGKEFVKRLSV